ncbi:MAG TPA: hypothetical protein V6D12_24265 [Candidatus Obscuribacterales bacterium]
MAPFMGRTWEVEVVLGGCCKHQAGARFFYLVTEDNNPIWGKARSVGWGYR